jgi:hypothetical protein
VLLGNGFSVRVAECGLAELTLSGSVTQVTSSVVHQPCGCDTSAFPSQAVLIHFLKFLKSN